MTHHFVTIGSCSGQCQPIQAWSFLCLLPPLPNIWKLVSWLISIFISSMTTSLFPLTNWSFARRRQNQCELHQICFMLLWVKLWETRLLTQSLVPSLMLWLWALRKVKSTPDIAAGDAAGTFVWVKLCVYFPHIHYNILILRSFLWWSLINVFRAVSIEP